MKKFLRQVSPKRAVSDFADQWRRPTPHRWQILGVACAATFALFMLFVPENQRMAPEAPDLIYISTLDENRSDSEIIAENCSNQRLQNELALAVEESEERKRELYRQLGRATFLDVDEMEREAAARRDAGEPAEDGPTEEELALSLEEYCARASDG